MAGAKRFYSTSAIRWPEGTSLSSLPARGTTLLRTRDKRYGFIRFIARRTIVLAPFIERKLMLTAIKATTPDCVRPKHTLPHCCDVIKRVHPWHPPRSHRAGPSKPIALLLGFSYARDARASSASGDEHRARSGQEHFQNGRHSPCCIWTSSVERVANQSILLDALIPNTPRCVEIRNIPETPMGVELVSVSATGDHAIRLAPFWPLRIEFGSRSPRVSCNSRATEGFEIGRPGQYWPGTRHRESSILSDFSVATRNG